MLTRLTVQAAVAFGVAVLLRSEVASAQSALREAALVDSLESLLDTHPVARRTTVALKVVDLESGEVLFDRNGDRLLVPASNLKIYTTAAALDLLGPQHRWTTRVYARTAIGTTIGEDGVVKGSLVLAGGGDPMLSSADLAGLADRLVSEVGITKVEEGIVVAEVWPGLDHNTTWNSLPLKGPGWMWDDEPDYYNMTMTRLMVDFNVLEVEVAPTALGEAAFASLKLPSAYPAIVNTAKTARGGELIITRRPFEHNVLVSGSISPGAEAVTERMTMHAPDRWIAGVFTEMLRARGVEVEENPRYALTIVGREPLLEHVGKPLSEIIDHFLDVSENAIGESLLLNLAERYQLGEESAESSTNPTSPLVTWPHGAAVITDWLVNEAGLDPESFHLVDGSGLSRYNLISADSAIRLLQFMRRHEHANPFFDALVRYEVSVPTEGTFHGVPLAEFDRERVFAKSGGMSSVLTISGYLQTLEGRWLAFSFLTNGYIGSNAHARSLRDAVWARLVMLHRADAPPAP